MRMIKVALGLAMSALATGAAGQDGAVSFTGRVVAATCIVEGISDVPGTGPDMVVRLPAARQAVLNRAGRRGTMIPFHLVIGSGEHPCQQANVRAMFRSVGHSNEAGRLNNQGTARNVDVVVLNAAFQDVQLITNENSLPIPIDENGMGVLSWWATYHATAAAQPGTVTAQVEYVLVYD